MINIPAFATEFGVVEKTIQFVAKWKGETHYFRVEATRLETGSYDTSVYMRESVRLSETMKIENSKRIDAEADHQIWVLFPDAPSSHGATADDAIRLQLALLDDRLKHV
jgi:hypothetical protein